MSRPALNTIALLASGDLSAAEVALRGIPNDDPGDSFVPVVMGKLKSGEAKLAQIKDGQKVIGWTVYQIDEGEGFREFVSVATKCFKTVSARVNLNEVFATLAKKENCQTMRMHTARHGLVKEALVKGGWHVAEIVLRKIV